MSLFAIDTRSLAAFRVGAAMMLLVHSLIAADLPNEYWFAWWRLALIPFALALLVGYRTRLATVGCLIVYGAPIRAALLDSATHVALGRYVLALFLFWALFLPLDRHLGSKRPSLKAGGVRLLSVASAGTLLQVFLIYFFAGINKHPGEWITQATAMRDVLASEFGTGLGHLVSGAEPAMAVASVFTVLIEVVGSSLLFVPGKGLARRRTVLVACFILFHLGMAIFMRLSTFPFVMIVIWLLFLPSETWDRFFHRESGSTAEEVDRNPFRAVFAGFTVVYVLGSNYITWMFYPADSGWQAAWQRVGVELLVYQQWAMFSIPSTLL